MNYHSSMSSNSRSHSWSPERFTQGGHRRPSRSSSTSSVRDHRGMHLVLEHRTQSPSREHARHLTSDSRGREVLVGASKYAIRRDRSSSRAQTPTEGTLITEYHDDSALGNSKEASNSSEGEHQGKGRMSGSRAVNTTVKHNPYDQPKRLRSLERFEVRTKRRIIS